MATRRIVAEKAATVANIVPTGAMKFSVTSDTGPVTGASIASAAFSLSNASTVGTGNDRMRLQVMYNEYNSAILGETNILAENASLQNIMLPLNSVQDALLTDDVSAVILGLQSETMSGTVMIEDGCTLTLQITYASRCGSPDNVRLSATQSSGGALLQWNAAANGDGNAVSYYEVARSKSTDGGSTWTGWDDVGTTPNLYMWVNAPATEGHMYRFYVRAVGTAGENFASYWSQSSNTLTKTLPKLNAYTDPTLTAGVTKVKAAHITELQTNINLVRAAANYAAYTFTTITAQYTGLGGWNAHIEELRSAIDQVFPSHETWLALGDNCPRADVLMQLRRVVEAVAND